MISSHGSKNCSSRSVVDTVQPPSGSTGLQGDSAPKPSVPMVWGTGQEEQYRGSRCPPHEHRDLLSCCATSAQAHLHLGVQHLASCALTQLLNAEDSKGPEEPFLGTRQRRPLCFVSSLPTLFSSCRGGSDQKECCV